MPESPGSSTHSDETPWLVVGLGNPGSKYDSTGHNVGFEVIDLLAQRWRAGGFKSDRESHYVGFNAVPEVHSGKVFLIKPQTFMNLSGNSVREWVRFYKTNPATKLLVVSDDLDLPPGQLRLRPSGSAGGHNGLKSLIEQLSTDSFARLRLGIGRDPRAGAVSYVLKKFNASQRKIFDEAVFRAAEGVELCLKVGVPQAMNTVNQKVKTEDLK